jgi:hypothetical protein
MLMNYFVIPSYLNCATAQQKKLSLTCKRRNILPISKADKIRRLRWPEHVAIMKKRLQ